MEEYKESLEKAGMYPEELNHMEVRLKKRIHHRMKKAYLTTLTSVAAVFLFFIFVVNTPTAMAEAILNMPVIGTLAKYVCFDKGLQNAIKNEYAKEVNLIDQNNGYSLGIPYVIADSKRLVIFFQVPENMIKQENDCIHIDINKIIDTATGKEFQEYTSDSPSYLKSNQDENDGLNYTSIRSIDTSIPQNLKIYVTMNREYSLTGNTATPGQASDLFEPSPHTNNEKLGEYVFELHLDNYPEPKIITLDREVDVLGQTIRINSVTEYPTGTEISVNIPDNNDCIINGLSFKAVDTNGEEWDNAGGVVSIGTTSDNHTTYYLQGNYFSSAALDKIQITGIRLYKKSEADITIDLQNKTMTPELSDLYIKNIERTGNKAYITFESDSDSFLGIFKHKYMDTAGNKYEIKSESSSQTDGKPENHLAVIWPKDNKVILTRGMSPMIKLKKPVEIGLNN